MKSSLKKKFLIRRNYFADLQRSLEKYGSVNKDMLKYISTVQISDKHNQFGRKITLTIIVF